VTAAGQELVLVVPRAFAMADGAWHGVRATTDTTILGELEEHATFRSRAAVESDPSLKQLIPYVVVRDGERWFLMRRTRAGGDERLHDRHSIGVGGHVNPEDGGIAGGLRREWREELRADFEPSFRFVGLLNDDTNAVGAVHLGVVYVTEADGRAVTIRETDKLSAAWATTDEVRALGEALETWSRLVFDSLVGAARAV
jgi:predicted NUDIX family phosphoesterase